jgi:hypothetical protein
VLFIELTNSAFVLTVATSACVVETSFVFKVVVRVEFAASVTKRTAFAASTPVETVFAISVLMEALVAVVSNVETEFVFPDEKMAELSVSEPVLRVLICREETFATDVYKFAVESVVVLNC